MTSNSMKVVTGAIVVAGAVATGGAVLAAPVFGLVGTPGLQSTAFLVAASAVLVAGLVLVRWMAGKPVAELDEGARALKAMGLRMRAVQTGLYPDGFEVIVKRDPQAAWTHFAEAYRRYPDRFPQSAQAVMQDLQRRYGHA